MTTVDPEIQFALRLQRRLFEVMGLAPDAWKEINGVMLTRDIDSQMIRIEIIQFGSPTKRFTIHETQI